MTTLETQWVQYRDACYPPKNGPLDKMQESETRQAFYAGALTFLTFSMEATKGLNEEDSYKFIMALPVFSFVTPQPLDLFDTEHSKSKVRRGGWRQVPSRRNATVKTSPAGRLISFPYNGEEGWGLALYWIFPFPALSERSKIMSTTLPWTLETVPTSIGHCHKIMPLCACIYVDHRDAKNKDSKTITAKADAELIVRAVNSHAALVAACKRFIDAYPHGINPGLDQAFGMAVDALAGCRP